MKTPIRVTIALDEESYAIFNDLRKDTKVSQSEIVRNALKFYYEYRELERFDSRRIKTYVELLSEGEHVILDIDHFISFLKFIETHPEKERFWEVHREVAKAHAEQFRGMDIEDVLFRLESCNFFRVNRVGENEWTLILINEIAKGFIRMFLEEVFKNLGNDIEIKEDLTKLRLRLKG